MTSLKDIMGFDTDEELVEALRKILGKVEEKEE